MTQRSENTPNQLRIYTCNSGHAFFVAHSHCPTCQCPLTESDVDNEAVLTSQTTVRVTPSGQPFRLGLARIQCGAKTLCLVGPDVPSDDDAPIVLALRDGLYHATRR
jgi:uncharacterized OB-fold protein